MANIPIRNIPLEGTPTGSAYFVFDDGQMKKGQVASLADAVRPVASQGDAVAGVDNTKVMPSLRVKESIASEVGVTLASKAQGDLANTALQPAAIGTTIQAYDADLQAIAALAPADDSFIQRKAGAWANRTVAQVRADLNAGQPYGPTGKTFISSDLNDIIESGRYTGYSMVNAPDAGWWTVDHMVQGNNPSGHATQVAYQISAPNIYIRTQSGGVWSAWTAVSAGGTAPAAVFPTRASVSLANIPTNVTAIFTSGFSAAGDGGGGGYLYSGLTPPNAYDAWVVSADGRYFELADRIVNVRQFGAEPDSTGGGAGADASPGFIKCWNFVNSKFAATPRAIRIPQGLWNLGAALPTFTGICHVFGENFGQPTILNKRYAEGNLFKGMISLGSYASKIEGLQFASTHTGSGGSFISAILPSVDTANVGILRIKDCYFSGGDRVNYNVFVDGQMNKAVGGPGYRSAFFTNCHFFGTAIAPVRLISCQHFFFINIFLATTGGTNADGYIFNADYVPGAPSDDIHFHGGIIAGNVFLDAARCTFGCAITGNATTSAGSDKITFMDVWGTRTLGGTSVRVLA